VNPAGVPESALPLVLADSTAALLLLGVVVAIGVVTVVAVGYGVYLDAAARSSDDAGTLGVLAAVFSVAVLPAYVLLRGRIGDRDAPTRRERRVRTLALGGLLTLAAAAAATVPDPYTQLFAATALYLPALFVSYLLVGR
jgi:drug/metabolite transporter (DMT)-like permease